MKNTTIKILATVGATAFFLILFTSDLLVPHIVTDVQSGEVQLECEFSDGWRDVPKDKVVGLDDISGRWIFTNGSASNCKTY